ncbi:Uncharacterised protein [Lelliottia amnigena]|jgi:hypothetical protein|nr:hypothetical protein CCAJJPOJ_04097 [Lelliottia sp. T2.26D-8]VDZ87382.1 Uncharacterised protein [Lelliottia amnigena]
MKEPTLGCLVVGQVAAKSASSAIRMTHRDSFILYRERLIHCDLYR